MGDVSGGWVVYDRDQHERNTFQVRNVSKEELRGDNHILKEPEEEQASKEKEQPLLADPKIVPVAKTDQAKIKIFDKVRFLKDVKRLDKKQNKDDVSRHAEKGRLILTVNGIRNMTVPGSDGQQTELPRDIREIFTLMDRYTASSAVAKKAPPKEATVFLECCGGR